MKKLSEVRKLSLLAMQVEAIVGNLEVVVVFLITSEVKVGGVNVYY